MTRIQRWLTAYDHVLKILEMNNDNYFKRTQIVMIVAQSVLFVAFGKLSTLGPDKITHLVVPQHRVLLGITLLGLIFALVWLRFIYRQCNVLDLCKGYLRGIESYLMQLGVPSGYWTYESKLSHPKPRKVQPVIHFAVDTRFFTQEPPLLPFPMKDDGKSFKDEHLDLLPRRRGPLLRKISWIWDWRKNRKFRRFRIGLTKIEKIIAAILCAVWVSLFLLILRSNC